MAKPHFVIVPAGEVPRTPQGAVTAACGQQIPQAECLQIWDEQPILRPLSSLSGCRKCAERVAGQSGVVYAVRTKEQG